jgi:hypothetical protein
MLLPGRGAGRRASAAGRRLPGAALALAAALAAGTAATTLTACAAPEHRFVASDADDVVIRVPRSWTVVRNGAPGTDPSAQPEPDGAWEAVYDADAKPDPKHLNLTHRAKAPVALARTWVVTKEQADRADGEALRNMILPVTATARAASGASSVVSSFRLLADEDVRSATARGVHVVFSYDLGEGRGREVFDQIAMVNSRKDRIHLFVVHCTQACYDTHRADISDAVDSFTVKVP